MKVAVARLALALLAGAPLALSLATTTGPARAATTAPAPQAQDAVDLFHAFKAAYGQVPPLDISVDEPDAGGAVSLKLAPAALVQVAPNIVMLISKAEAPFSCGRFCTGSLFFHYLRRTPAGFEALGAWKDIGGENEFGAAPAWTVRHDLFEHAALELRMANGGGGCGVETASLIELTPLGPVVRADGILVDNHSDSAQFTGKIEPSVRGSAFQVVYAGSVSKVIRYDFDRPSDRYLPKGVEVKPSC